MYTKNWPETREDVYDNLSLAQEILHAANRRTEATYDAEWTAKLAMIQDAEVHLASAKLDLERMIGEYKAAMAGRPYSHTEGAVS